ncbi:MAG: hypothetical protein F6K42_24190 [Leptolyngbya sp. SIO1D8]|nr:hypothetical protein [Leptolyngbya sp. SIO1D8]
MEIADTPMTLDGYLAYNDDTDLRYEWVNVGLVSMPPDSRMNARIALFLITAKLLWKYGHATSRKDDSSCLRHFQEWIPT